MMKILLILLFLLISTTISASSYKLHTSDESPPSAALDTAKQHLLTTSTYYIIPVLRGGLTLATARNKMCPLDVVQERMEIQRGVPFKFLPAAASNTIVKLFTDLNIKFVDVALKELCDESSFWRVGEYDEITKQFYMTTGGVEGNPGAETVSSRFKIEKLGEDYKLVFCPSVCEYCKVVCRDVGVVVENRVRRLSLSDQPLRVMLSKQE